MGLLSDPNLNSSNKKSKYVTLVSKYSNSFCFLFYIAGILWFSALSFKELQSKTYFSENALLPGNEISVSQNKMSSKVTIIDKLQIYFQDSFFPK